MKANRSHRRIAGPAAGLAVSAVLSVLVALFPAGASANAGAPDTVQLKLQTVQLTTDTVQLKTDTVQLKTDTVQLKTDTVQLKTQTVQLGTHTVHGGQHHTILSTVQL